MIHKFRIHLYSGVLLLLFLNTSALAGGQVNQRQHAAPETMAKVHRQLANAYAQGDMRADKQTVSRGGGATAALEIGTTRQTGRAPREQNIITGDNTVICLHCRGR